MLVPDNVVLVPVATGAVCPLLCSSDDGAGAGLGVELASVCV